MKNLLILCCLFLLFSCGFNNQKKEIEALAKCTFSLEKIDNASIAGTSIKTIIEKENINVMQLPNIVMGFMNKSLPLDAVISLKVTNPTDEEAAMNAFDYIILFEDVEIASGEVNQSIRIASKDAQVIPIHIRGDVYELIQNNGEQFLNFFTKSNTVAKLTFKVKPSINVAGNLVKSPAYFSMDKQVTREMFIK